MYEGWESRLLQALGRAIRVRRLELDISQEHLAEIADMHRTYVADVERGSRNIGFINLVRLAEALELPLSDLLQGITMKKGGKGSGKDTAGPARKRHHKRKQA